MKIKATFSAPFGDGDIITTDTNLGETYLVDSNLDLHPNRNFIEGDFKEGKEFFKIGHQFTRDNCLKFRAEVLNARLLSYSFEE